MSLSTMDKTVKFRRTKRPRDSKKSAIYKAETEIFGDLGSGNAWAIGDGSLEAVKSRVWFIVSTKAWRKLCLKYGRPGYRYADVRVTGRKGAKGFTKGINLGTWHRNQWMVLHELAHTLTVHDHIYAIHGAKFCSAYIALVRRFMNVESARLLKAEFLKRNIKVVYRRKES
jgi:hypothetical protein